MARQGYSRVLTVTQKGALTWETPIVAGSAERLNGLGSFHSHTVAADSQARLDLRMVILMARSPGPFAL